MSVTRDIFQSYIRPRRVMRRHLARGVSEGRVFVFLVAACLLIFIAQWPRLSREAHLDSTVPLEGLMVAAIWAWGFVAPLMFYGVAGISYLLVKIVGGKGTGLGARLALFWTLLVLVPLWLLYGLVAGFVGAGVQLDVVGAVLLLAFFWIWISSLIETQRRPPDTEKGTEKGTENV